MPRPSPGRSTCSPRTSTRQDPLRDTVEWLLRDGRGGDTGEAAWVTERVTVLAASDAAGRSPFAPSFATVGALAEVYPGDPGIVISLLLNRVRLRRGEALYLAAGNIHAYLAGLGIELMAASDNVLRGGLTPKHIDVTELLDVLDFTPIEPPRLAPEAVAPGVLAFRPDVPDFVLYRVEPGAGRGRLVDGCRARAARRTGHRARRGRRPAAHRRAGRDVLGPRRRGVRDARRGRRRGRRRRDRLDRDDGPARGIRSLTDADGVRAPSTVSSRRGARTGDGTGSAWSAAP